MQTINKITKILSIPYSGFSSVIFGMMILSFPVGLYVTFNSEIGKDINYQYPINGLDLFIGGISYKIPISFEIGDAFIIAWSIFIILFSISYLGPEDSFLKTLSNMMSRGSNPIRNNGLSNMITWFSILIVSSVVIETIQQIFGIKIEPPSLGNDLVRFFQISISPLTEETGFRVLLIGVPLFLMYSHSTSLKIFFKSLWRPSKYLSINNYQKPMMLIITIGLLFGVSHIISGTPWSPGKVTQATIAGIIIGWVYVRYGFAPAILIHWATNYFLSSYLFFISDLSQNPAINDSSNPFSDTLEMILIVTGAIAIIIKVLSYIESRNTSSVKQML
ncbi:MAG: CPBP family intramembrane metalloprotease [Thaumarchaeota archaeon]|nr:CPBP family intramembrane metalloprotease [Nitrososphaerota archaeon]